MADRPLFGAVPVITGLAVLGVAPTAATAQFAVPPMPSSWESPVLLGSSGGSSGLGLSVFAPFDAELGLVIGYRTTREPVALGFRLGATGDGFFEKDPSIFGGVDVSGTLLAPQDVPIEVFWLLGVGLSVGDAVRVSFPLGIGASAELRIGPFRVAPYAAPRLVADTFHDPPRVGDFDNRTEAAVDFGLDVVDTSGLTIRFAVTEGDGRETVSVGLAVP